MKIKKYILCILFFNVYVYYNIMYIIIAKIKTKILKLINFI